MRSRAPAIAAREVAPVVVEVQASDVRTRRQAARRCRADDERQHAPASASAGKKSVMRHPGIIGVSDAFRVLPGPWPRMARM